MMKWRNAMSETNKKKLLYQQLKEHILEDYKNQPYHTPLPGERALCDIYHVSRPIIRTIPIINFKRQTTKRGGYSLRNILPNRFKYLFYLIKTQYLEYLLYLCFQETLRLT